MWELLLENLPAPVKEDRWQALGFPNTIEYKGWLDFNRLMNEQYEGYEWSFDDAVVLNTANRGI